MPAKPTLQRRVRIYAGWVDKGFGLKPTFPIDGTMVELAAQDVRSTIAWHKRRAAHLTHVLGRINADGRSLRRNGHNNGHGGLNDHA